jgi:hypothetical protein
MRCGSGVWSRQLRRSWLCYVVSLLLKRPGGIQMKPIVSLLLSLGTVLSALECAQAANAQPVAEPTWPQHFEAFKGEPAAFGFIVTQPGPISVSVAVQSSAAPVLVTLSGPVAKPIQQQGAGTFQVAYMATAADVQRGYLWLVHVDSMNAPTVVQGTVAVSHPSTDMKLAIQQLQGLDQRLQSQRDAGRAASVAKVRAAFAADEQARQRAKQQLASAQALRTQQLLKSIGAPGVQTRGVLPATLAPAASVRPGMLVSAPIVARPTFIAPPPPPPPPPPAITSLSVGEGQPGDPVLITGASFGTAGEVHFLVNPGMDVVAPVDYWSNAQIVAHVPTVTGIQRYGGQMYVKASNQASALQPFIFDPTLDSQLIWVFQANLTDAILGSPSINVCPVQTPPDLTNCSAWHTDPTAPGLIGHRGDDNWYLYTNLNSGWIVESAQTYDQQTGSGWGGSEGEYIADNRPGTTSLYTKVHWWEDAGCIASYLLVISVKGPVGTSPL